MCSFHHINDYCNTQFATPEALFLHIQIYHVDLTRFICGDAGCGRTFQRLDTFKRHVKNKHPHAIQNPAQLVAPAEQIELVNEPAGAEPMNIVYDPPEIDDFPLQENELAREPEYISNKFAQLYSVLSQKLRNLFLISALFWKI